jgi:hypothetical protein
MAEKHQALIDKIDRASAALAEKRAEKASIEPQIQQCETKLQQLTDADEIRDMIRERDELKKEHEVLDLVLKGCAVTVEDAHANLHLENLITVTRPEAARARAQRLEAEAGLKEAEAVLTAAKEADAKAEHDMAQDERRLTLHRNNAANLRSGNLAA